MFLGLVFDVFNHESYTRHIFTNATVKNVLLQRMKTVSKFVSLFETRIVFQHI